MVYFLRVYDYGGSMSSYDDMLRDIARENWLRANPGKTANDYDAHRIAEDATLQRQKERNLEQRAEGISSVIVLVIRLCFRHLLAPMACAWAVRFIIPSAPFWPSVLAFAILLIVLKR